MLAVNQKGKKENLGLYLSESEGANFWLSVLTDLKNRGVEDFLIASEDGLIGFPEAITTILPAHRGSALYRPPDSRLASIRGIEEPEYIHGRPVARLASHLIISSRQLVALNDTP